ncbi:hypothetical protein AKO1_003796 [Acrasis kona]|uniref:Uncharacterized protein n=1 Tax=Acrasis kona TaxID=1008807 RepID=A0AAW2Z594_9EUKA
MGTASSKDIEMMNDVYNLAFDPGPWKAVVNRFLNQPMSAAFYKLNIDTHVLKTMCSLLSQQQNDEDQCLLINVITKLLTNPYLYKQVFKDATTLTKDSSDHKDQEVLFSFTRYILQPILNSYTKKNVVLHSMELLRLLVCGRITIKNETSTEPEEESQIVDSTSIIDMRELFALHKGLDMLQHILDYYYARLDERNENVITIVESILEIFVEYSKELPTEGTNRNTTMGTVSVLIKSFFGQKKASSNSFLFSTIIPLSYSFRFNIRQRATDLIIRLYFYATVNEKLYVHDCAAANGAVLEQLLILCTHTEIELHQMSIALLSVFCGHLKVSHNPNLKLLSNLLPHNLFLTLLDRIKTSNAFQEVHHQFEEAHLIWNSNTKEHLIKELTSELTGKIRPCFLQIRSRPIGISEWNFLCDQVRDFHVDYSEFNEVQSCGKYVRIVCRDVQQQVYTGSDQIEICDGIFDQMVMLGDSEQDVNLRNKMIGYMTVLRGFTSKHITYLTKQMLSESCSPDVLSALLNACRDVSLAKECDRSGGLGYLMIHLERINHEYALSQVDSHQVTIILLLLDLLSILVKLARVRSLILSDRSYFHCIVKTILIPDTLIVQRSLELIKDLMEGVGAASLIHSNFDRSQLYKSGIFEFVVRQMRLGCTETIATFLKQYHDIQDQQQEQPGSSYLGWFLPMQLVNLLNKKDNSSITNKSGSASKTGIELFTLAINQISTNLRPINPYMIWSTEHCDKMIQHVDDLIKPFVKKLYSSNGFVDYEHVKPRAITFDDISNELCIKNVFVKRFLLVDSQMVDEPEDLMLGLIEETSLKKHSVDDLLLIIQAQKKLYNTQDYEQTNASSLFRKYTAYDTIFNLLSGIEPSEQIYHQFLILCSQLILLTISMPDTFSYNNKLLFICKFNGLEWICSSLTGNNIQCREFVLNMISIMDCLSDVICAETDLELPPNFYIVMSSFINPQYLNDDIEIVKCALKCMNSFVHQNDAVGLKSSASSILALVRLAVICPYKDEVQLKACCLGVVMLRDLSCDRVRSILIQTLTYNIYLMMVDSRDNFRPDTFCKFVRTNVRHPLYLWNQPMRDELEKFINHKLKNCNTDNQIEQCIKVYQPLTSKDEKEVVLAIKDYSNSSSSVLQYIYVDAFNETWIKVNPPSLYSFLNHLSTEVCCEQITDARLVQSIFESMNSDLQELVNSDDHSTYDLRYRTSVKSDMTRLIMSTSESKTQNQGSGRPLLYYLIDNESYLSVLVHLYHHTLQDAQLHCTSEKDDERHVILGNLLSVFSLIAQHYINVLLVMRLEQQQEDDDDDEEQQNMIQIQRIIIFFSTHVYHVHPQTHALCSHPYYIVSIVFTNVRSTNRSLLITSSHVRLLL